VLAISSGVVRRYLLERSALPAKSMTAAVPISLREDGNTDANNQVFGMICSIATNIEDPKARLEAIIAQSTKSKEMSHPLRALMPQVSNLSMLGAPIMVQIMALLYSRSSLSDVLPPAANITVSNVPGPRQTLYAAGARCRLRPMGLPSTSRCRAIAINWISASSPAPTSFLTCRFSATCCPGNSPHWKPRLRLQPISKARRAN